VPLLVALVGIGCAIALAIAWQRVCDARERTEFDAAVHDATAAVDSELARTEDALRAARGLFASSHHVRRPARRPRPLVLLAALVRTQMAARRHADREVFERTGELRRTTAELYRANAELEAHSREVEAFARPSATSSRRPRTSCAPR